MKHLVYAENLNGMYKKNIIESDSGSRKVLKACCRFYIDLVPKVTDIKIVPKVVDKELCK